MGGEPCIPGDDIICPPAPIADVIDLGPREEQELQIPWDEVTPDQHMIQIVLGLPDTFPDFEFQRVQSWNVIIPFNMADTAGCSLPQKDNWQSIGPRTVTVVPPQSNFGAGANVGRMDRIAFHPYIPDIMYASAPSGGVWKTADRGDNWAPLWDGMSFFKCKSHSG